ncbi:unnamed protein product [Rotaria sp. Silwood1]|nr:unnamed protein product [Rotaria sp. Silwood1]CAF4904711.1 unnamed protein product [Rotaria sp. Silwood1]
MKNCHVRFTDSLWDTGSITKMAAKKVLFMIADGIPADVIENVPITNINKIRKIGSYTRVYVGGDNGTYTETPTISAPCYMDLLTGTWGNKHNVSDNNSTHPNYHYRNIFRLFKEEQPDKKIAIFSQWIINRIKLVGEGLPEAGNIMFDYKFDGYDLDEVAYPHDPEEIYIYNIDHRVTYEASICVKTNGPDLSWVYLDNTDAIGHRFGDSEYFNQAVLNLDNEVEQIWAAIEYRIKYYKEDWLFILTTDHGRDSITGKKHGKQSLRERTTWIVTNIHQTNSYFHDFEPTIVDILPTIARFVNLTVPLETQRELDGVPLIGKVSLIKPDVSLDGDTLRVRWKALDTTGNVKVWLSTTNLYMYGMTDDYKLVKTIPIDKEEAIIDVKLYLSKFYKIVLEGQYNMVNRWVFRS